MPLPTLPGDYRKAAYQDLINHLPIRWFHGLEDERSPLSPMLWGLAEVLAHVRWSYEQSVRAAIPRLSGGPWLTLHMKSIGLERRATETDAKGIERYEWEFRPTRNTRDGELAALAYFLGLEVPQLRLETDRAIGKFGQFRVVLDDETLPWGNVDFTFIGPFVQRYVSNGIIPSVDAKLQCLLYAPLKPWQFYDQFPTSYNTQGPIWERPAFISPLRLDFARNLFTQVSALEWRNNRDRLMRLFRDGLSDAPGAVFLYLSDEGACPYLLVDYDLELSSEDIEQTFPPRPFDVDGWHFYDGFLYYGAGDSTDFLAPFLEVPSLLIAPFLELEGIQELHEVFENFPGDSQSGQAAFQYGGLDFTRRRVARFLLPESPNTDPEFTSEQLDKMRSGPWELKISAGNPDWGNFPPQGTTFTGAAITLTPKSIWWSDASGDARSFTALWDGVAVYLCIEFLFPKTEITIREFELLVDGDRVTYRRFALPVDEQNVGFLFKVRGVVD